MRHKIIDIALYTSLFTVMAFSACKKEKFDMAVDNRAVTESRGTSLARVINFGEYNQVVVVKDTMNYEKNPAGELVVIRDSLTNFTVLNSNTPDYYKYPGTSYFPTDGRLGQIWNVPQDLFGSKDTVALKFGTRNYLGGSSDRDFDLTVKNRYNTATDYFLFPSNMVSGMKDMVSVSREVTSPAKADHFKIRIVNLGVKFQKTESSPSGDKEDISGPVSLAYADGTLVSNKTNNISSEQISSEYIELPYGTYQFRLLLADGRQIPALGKETVSLGLIDMPTSTLPYSYDRGTNLHYAPIATYQPGGVYTLVVVPQRFGYIVDDVDNTSDVFQNSFQLITDVEPDANRTYFRAQAANAYQVGEVSFHIAGKTLGNVSFGKASDYMNFIQGSYTIEAKDASGQVLATTQQTLRAAQNYTFWLYPTAEGKPSILMLANDLSGALPNTAQDDATFSRSENHFFFFKRFLNLSVGNPYITFTVNNGQGVSNALDNANAAQNLQPGIAKVDRPYLIMGEMLSPFEILAYRSTPSMLPGFWADDIPVLMSDAFIANKALYTGANRSLPVQEAGVYTVALIGKSNGTASATEKAKMIIVKHNK